MDSLPTLYQEYIHLSRYSRWLPKENRRETWPETVSRYMEFFKEHLQTNFEYDLKEPLYSELYNTILELKVMPSMRALMTAGPALKRSNIAGFNCSALAIDRTTAFDELLYILMNGTGVGFSVERQAVNKLPEIADEFHKTDTVIHVADSKEGWAKAYKELIHLLYGGQIPKWDVSKVRPAGTPLKIFGGRASGSDCLVDLFEFTINMFRNAAGRKLTSIECHDLCCKIADIVVVGGVRRAALISLSNLSDDRMRHAKAGQWWENEPHRALSNNSAVYTEKPDMSIFMKEWIALYESRSGERGIFNRMAAKLKCESILRDSDYDFLTNPCVPYDTPILTSKGYVSIGDVVDQKIEIWNGAEFAEVIPIMTGISDTVMVTFSDGTSLECTPYHKFIINGQSDFIEARNLRNGDKLKKFDMPVIKSGLKYPIDAYSQGFYTADGNKDREYSYIYEPKFCVTDRLVGIVKDVSTESHRKRWKHGPMYTKDWVPVEASLEYKLEWLAGLLDGDGTVIKNPNSTALQLTSINKQFLDKVRLMLTTIGVQAKVTLMEYSAYKTMPGGEYLCADCYRLLINASDTANLLSLGLKPSRLQFDKINPNRDARRFVTVQSVVACGPEQPVYCFTEPKTGRGTFNGIITGQCGEIILRPNGFCNLTEAVIRPDDTEESLKQKIELAVILGTFQSTLTKFKYISRKWQNNAEEERLLGVSLTGIMDNELTNGKRGDLKGLLSRLRAHTKEINKKWSKTLGINQSAAITTVKPSGTVSSLVNSASGIHTRHAPYYIRTVRADKKDPVSRFMVREGFPVEDDITKPEYNYVFSFPVESPKKAVFRDDLSAIEQLEVWLTYREYWCDHNPSVTISVKEHEWMEVGAWVYENFDSIGGVSFLPYSEHVYRQAPFQECTKKEYDDLLAKMPKDIDWSQLSNIEKEDHTTSMREFACVGNACEIVM